MMKRLAILTALGALVAGCDPMMGGMGGGGSPAAATAPAAPTSDPIAATSAAAAPETADAGLGMAADGTGAMTMAE